MAITVILEDGSGVEDANSYIETSYVDYIEELEGIIEWNDASQDNKNKYVIRATNLIDRLYGSRMRGDILDAQQSLLYPRGSFMDGLGRLVLSNTIPKALKDAAARAAIGYAKTDIDLVSSDFDKENIKKESVSIGPISESVEYYDKEVSTTKTREEVTVIISPLIKLPSRQFSVSRG